MRWQTKANTPAESTGPRRPRRAAGEVKDAGTAAPSPPPGERSARSPLLPPPLRGVLWMGLIRQRLPAKQVSPVDQTMVLPIHTAPLSAVTAPALPRHA